MSLIQVRASLEWDLRVKWMDEQRGVGLVADCDIPSGQYVIEYIGEVRVCIS